MPKAPFRPKPGQKSKTAPGHKPDQKSDRAPAPAKVPVHKSNPTRLVKGEILYGRHAVLAALGNADREHRQLLLADADEEILSKLPRGLSATRLAKKDIDGLLRQHGMDGAVHQGIVLITQPLPELDLGDILRDGAATGPILLLDQVTDPHNVGAILRSAAVFGAAAVITTERNAPDASGLLAKAASGAAELVPLVRVVNLARTLEELGDAGYWRIGLAEGGSNTIAEATKGHAKVALVLGAEGPGLRRLTKERCDELALLPAAGGFTTLNVSNAAAVALYAVTNA